MVGVDNIIFNVRVGVFLGDYFLTVKHTKSHVSTDSLRFRVRDKVRVSESSWE